MAQTSTASSSADAFRRLPWFALLAVGGGCMVPVLAPDPTRIPLAMDGGTREYSDSPAAQACSICHGRRARHLEQGAHAGLKLGCVRCHAGCDDHVESFGRTPAPTPMDLPIAAARALCTSCHQTGDPPFVAAHDTEAKRDGSCQTCHPFHDLAGTAPIRPSATTQRSHGVDVSPRDRDAGPSGARLSGSVEVGVAGVSGYSRQYRSDVNRSPGPRLIRALIEGRDGRPDADIDHAILELQGIGEPHASGRLRLGRRNAWELRASASRFEERFDPTTPLHDMFSTRWTGDLSLELQPTKDLRLTFAYDRFNRDDDGIGYRYREIANEVFAPTDLEHRETADLGRVRVDWDLGDWDIHFKQSARWWREQDDRSFVSPNLLSDDFEDYTGRSRAFTSATHLAADGELMNGRLHVDAEFMFAWSRRRIDADGTAGGLTAAAVPYLSVLGADGVAFGRYARLELGFLYEATNAIDLELRLRGRHDDEDSRFGGVETVTTGGGGPVPTLLGASSSARHLTFDVEGLARLRPFRWLTAALGYSGRFGHLDVSGPRANTVDPVDHGVIADLVVRPLDRLTVRGRLRAFSRDDPYTLIAPDWRTLVETKVRYRPWDDLALGAGWSISRARLSASGSRADRDTVFASVSWRDEDAPWSAALSWSFTDEDTAVDTVAIVGGFPTPYEARFRGHGHVWSGSATWRPADAVRFSADIDLADGFRDNRFRFLHTAGSVAWDVDEDVTLRFGIHYWYFDGTESDRDDFDATLFEGSVTWRF